MQKFKFVLLALTFSAVCRAGSCAAVLVAADLFSDVPAGHWAYESLARLTADGVIDGYGDGTYRGNHLLTRYEMAQMIARAMAKNDVSSADKAMIDKFAAEFADALSCLGIRVARLKKRTDDVRWTGKYEYTYHSYQVRDGISGARVRENANAYLIRLEPEARINAHWTAHARLDAEGAMNDAANLNVILKRAWAQGNYGSFEVRLGRFDLCPWTERGVLWDTEIAGAEASFGSAFRVTALAGRLAAGKIFPGERLAYDRDWLRHGVGRTTDYAGAYGGAHSSDPSDIWGLRFQ